MEAGCLREQIMQKAAGFCDVGQFSPGPHRVAPICPGRGLSQASVLANVLHELSTARPCERSRKTSPNGHMVSGPVRTGRKLQPNLDAQ